MAKAIWLGNELGEATENFQIGSTIFVAGRGLHPATLYDFHLLDQQAEGEKVLLASYTTDRHGCCPRRH